MSNRGAFTLQTRFERLWHKLTAPSTSLEDIQDQQRARLIAAFLVSVQPIVPLAILAALVLIPAEGAPFPIIIPLALMANMIGMVAYGFSRTRYYQVGAALLVFAASSAIFLAAYIANTPTDAVFSMFYMIVPILLGGVFLNSPMTTVIAALHIAAILVLPAVKPEVTLTQIGQPLFFNVILSPLVILIFRHRSMIERQRVTLIEAEKHKADLLAVELNKERELDELQNQFMAQASHQFRTPLAAIHVSAEIMLHYADRLTSDQRMEHLQNILSQTQRTNALVDNIFILTRLTKGKVLPQPIWFDLDTFCRDIVQAMQPDPPRLNLKITGALNHVYLDTDFMRLIVRSSLGNALKYSTRAVDIHVLRDAQSVIITIQDRGIGIPQADLAHIYDPFFRGSNVGENITGMGLGLTIIKAYVELQDGQIIIDSTVGQGTCLTISLPLTVDDVKATA